MNAWVTRNKCKTPAVITKPYPTNIPSSQSSKSYWGPGDCGVEMVLLTLSGKGHWHSNDDAGVHTSKEIWNFVRKYTTACGTNAGSVAITAPLNNATFTAPASITIDATATKTGGTISKVEFYNGTTKLGEDASSPYSYSWTNVAAGTYSITAVATDNTNAKITSTAVAIKVNPAQGAYNGITPTIPGKIEFEHYDVGGNGSAYQDGETGNTGGAAFRTDEDVDIETCTDAGAGYNIGFATAGEWLEYTVNVATAGKYNITIRAACNGDGRTISLSSNGTTIANNIAIPNTTGWQIWQDVVVKDVNLSAGTQVLRLTVGTTDYVNLNYMSFAPTSVAPTVKLTSPAAGSEFNTSQTVTISATASSTTGTIANVKFYAGTILLATDESSPYSFEWKDMTVGNYEITATATDNTGATASDKVTIKINAAPISNQLKKGWNLIGCPIDGSTDLAVALSSIWSNVEAIKDLESFYLKSNPTYLNSLTQVKWGQGYLVKVDKDCSLNWNK
ncbi:MAG: carbohydrate-binding protein [Bacteroidales bacterium]|nr:carbohydrate-binding protein [Bacteroidales bacterium]